jgi:phosphate transport system substrate-binding protein
MMHKAILGVLLVCLGVGASAQTLIAQTLINGAGATFPYPMYTKWFDEYHKKTGVQINYASIGSSGGIKQVTDGTVDFGASDGPMSDDQLKTYKDKHGFDVLHFPTVLGGVAVTYNLPGLSAPLNFSGPTLARIYLGKITKWNAPEIAKDNPGVKLPGDDVIPVHRAEGSGTTYVWTDFLSKVSPEWEKGVGRQAAPKWPEGGLGGKGSDGVSSTVKETKGAIGYVEVIYALQTKMPVAKVKNASGNFVAPNLASVTAAAGAAAATMPDDFRVSITNAAAKDAYPISTFTWLLIPSKIADPAKKKAMTDFLKWMLGDGQKMTEALNYSQLPKPVVAKEVKAIAKVM